MSWDLLEFTKRILDQEVCARSRRVFVQVEELMSPEGVGWHRGRQRSARGAIARALSFLLGTVVLAAVCVLSGCGTPTVGRDDTRVSAAPGGIVEERGVRVEFPPGALSEDTTVSLTAPTRTPSLGQDIVDLGGPLDISIGTATLLKPVKLELPVDPSKLPSDAAADLISLAFLDERTDRWIGVPTAYDPSRNVAVAEVKHFSTWRPITVDLAAIENTVRQGLLPVLRLTGARASPPECGDAPKGSSFDTYDPFTDPVLARVEADGKGAKIKLVNNRGYSVVVNPVPRATVSSRSHGGVADLIVRSLEDRDNTVYVPAGGQVTFRLDDPLPPGQVFGVGPTHLSMLADIFAPVATKLLPHVSNAKSHAEMVAAQGAWLLATTDCLLKRADDGPRSLTDFEGLAAVVRDCLNTASAAWPQLAKIVHALNVPLLVAETANKLGNALLDLSVLNNRRFLTFTFTLVRTDRAQSQQPRTQPARPPTQPDTDSPPVCTAGDTDKDGVCDDVDTCTGGGADLEPTAITYDVSVVQAGQSVYFDSGVENQGAVDSGVFNIKWLVDGQEVGAYGSHAGVPAKSTVMDGNSQFTWTFDSPGTYKLTFAVDADDHVQCEANESDNVRYKTVEVQRAANEEEPEEAAPTPEETPTTEPSETRTSAPTETTTASTPEPSEAAKASTAPGTTPSASVPFYTLAPTP